YYESRRCNDGGAAIKNISGFDYCTLSKRKKSNIKIIFSCMQNCNAETIFASIKHSNVSPDFSCFTFVSPRFFIYRYMIINQHCKLYKSNPSSSAMVCYTLYVIRYMFCEETL